MRLLKKIQILCESESPPVVTFAKAYINRLGKYKEGYSQCYSCKKYFITKFVKDESLGVDENSYRVDCKHSDVNTNKHLPDRDSRWDTEHISIKPELFYR